MSSLREGVKIKLKVTDRSATKILFFREEKKMQNVLKRKNMYFDGKVVKYVHLDLFYAFDYSGPFDMHVKKEKTYFFFSKVCSRFLPYEGVFAPSLIRQVKYVYHV